MDGARRGRHASRTHGRKRGCVLCAGAGNSSDAAQAMRSLGFAEKNGIYSRKGTPYAVESPPGPLMVGADYISDFATARRGDEVLYVLHRTDSVHLRQPSVLRTRSK